jgi:hypothetical protein
MTLPLMEGSQNKFLKSIHPHTIFVNESGTLKNGNLMVIISKLII